MKSFEKMSLKVLLKNGYKEMHVNWASSTRQTQTLQVLLRNKREKNRVERMRMNKKVVSMLVMAWHYSVLTPLDYMGQGGFEYSDITAAGKIRTAVRKSLNSSQKQVTITNYKH
jgi:hypothetical protein